MWLQESETVDGKYYNKQTESGIYVKHSLGHEQGDTFREKSTRNSVWSDFLGWGLAFLSLYLFSKLSVQMLRQYDFNQEGLNHGFALHRYTNLVKPNTFWSPVSSYTKYID